MNCPFPEISDEVYGDAMKLTGYMARTGFTLEAIHQYTHADGSPWWWVLRWKAGPNSKKSLYSMRRNGPDYVLKRPIFGQEGPPLYRLHTLNTKPDELVYVTEGEPKVDLLESLGFLATTWPGGAASVERNDWTPLSGRRIVLWPDNDAPGLEAMRKLRPILHKLGTQVVTLDVSALNLPPKGDVVDWMAGFVAKHGAEDLSAIPKGPAMAEAEIRAFDVELAA